VIQLEDACRIDGVTESINAGFTGTGYANTNNVLGAVVGFSLSSDAVRQVTLTFRYACGSANARNMSLAVNGTTQVAVLGFPSTGAFTTWRTATAVVSLAPGYNQLTLTSLTAEGAPNLDQVSWVSAGVSDGHCVPPTPTVTGAALTAASVTAFPNPSTGNGTHLSVQLSGNGTVAASGIRAQDAGTGVGMDPSARVTLKVYTLGGRLIWSTTLPGSSFGSTGDHSVYWDERDLAGAQLSNGLYNVEVEVRSQGHSSRALSRVVILR
jgi:hypothetical protein